MEKNTTQQIRLVLDYWQTHGDSWADVAVPALSTMAGHAADLPLIDIRPVAEFVASHGSTAFDKIDPDAGDIPYVQQQIRLIGDMDVGLRCPCDDITDRLVAGDATVRDICQLIICAWQVCNQRAARNRKPVYSLCMALIRTAKCWPSRGRESEKDQIAEILKTVITDAENQTRERYYDDIIF